MPARGLTRERKRTGWLRFVLYPAALAALSPSERPYAADIALGEYLSAECVTCHQLSGHTTGGIPSIVGLSENHFIEALMAYKNGERHNEVMRTIANRLTAEEMEAIAAYFAKQSSK